MYRQRDMARSLTARHESWALKRPFRISRGTKTAADVVVVEIRDGGARGRGEAVPYARYGESIESVLAQIASASPVLEAEMTRAELQALLPHGAARNAVDCALWELEAQLSGRSVAALAGAVRPDVVTTAVTISLDTPEQMAAEAGAVAHAPLLKVKLSAQAPLQALAAVHAGAPQARLIADPNEGWTPQILHDVLPHLAAFNVALIEQPIPASEDDALLGLTPPVPICADESAHVSADLDRIAERYQSVNIKLDKAGGLTEALIMRRRARELGLSVMVGCMVATSLAIEPALLLACDADFVDLDGPWWIATDRPDGVRIENGRLFAPERGWSVPA